MFWMIHSWDAGGFAAASWSTLTARMVFGSVIHHPFVQILRLRTERKIKTCNVLHVKLVNTPLKKKKKWLQLATCPSPCLWTRRGWWASGGHLSPNLTAETQWRLEKTRGAVHWQILIQLGGGVFLSRLLCCIVLRCLAQWGRRVVFIGKPFQRMTRCISG